jgi:hypothetical protein
MQGKFFLGCGNWTPDMGAICPFFIWSNWASHDTDWDIRHSSDDCLVLTLLVVGIDCSLVCLVTQMNVTHLTSSLVTVISRYLYLFLASYLMNPPLSCIPASIYSRPFI